MAILVVEDERELSDILVYVLKRAGFDVVCAHDGLAALKMMRSDPPSLVLLDVNLPRMDGWEICRQVRSSSSVPIVMLTGERADEDIVRGLNSGADDYITKPFSPAQLVARIEAVLRRTTDPRRSPRARMITVGEIEIDLQTNAARLSGRDVHLTNLEFRLLHALSMREGHVVRHQDLIQRVWGYQGVADGRMLKSHVRNLRRKIEPNPEKPKYIQTVPSVGYRFTAETPVVA